MRTRELQRRCYGLTSPALWLMLAGLASGSACKRNQESLNGRHATTQEQAQERNQDRTINADRSQGESSEERASRSARNRPIMEGEPSQPTRGQAPTPFDTAGESLANEEVKRQQQGDLLVKIHRINRHEIKAAELAQQRAFASAVRDFAEQMIKDHSQADEKLESLAQQLDITLQADGQPSTIAEQQMRQEHANELARLQVLAGEAFDHAYIELMVQGHEKALEAIDKGLLLLDGSPVASLLSKLRPTIAEHRAAALRLQQGQTSANP